VRDVVASHDALIHLFERIHFFLQRLKSYTGMPLTNESRELLGKIMAQLLSILALSTKAMTDRRFSELIGSLCFFFLADCDSEKILKKLVGKTDVEDALLRLDMLTKDESLMMVVRNLEVTHHVDGIVHDVDDNVKATKAMTEDIDDNVKATKVHMDATRVIIEGIDDSVKGVARGVDNGTQHFLSVVMHILTLYPVVSQHSCT
jgi:hypothetical protein